MLLEGRQLDRYHILHLLGSGGAGDVYVAQDQHIGQTVAIKVIRVEEGMQTAEIQRATQLFLREARMIVTLDHPNILALFDYGLQQVDGPMAQAALSFRSFTLGGCGPFCSASKQCTAACS